MKENQKHRITTNKNYNAVQIHKISTLSSLTRHGSGNSSGHGFGCGYGKSHRSLRSCTKSKDNLHQDNLLLCANQEDIRKNRIRLIYRLCQGKKDRIFKERSYMPGNVLDLIDRFRSILDAMLEDENEAYPKEEILSVSRTLDDMIYYYYCMSAAATASTSTSATVPLDKSNQGHNKVDMNGEYSLLK